MTIRTRAPRAPTQAPTGSTLLSLDQTAILVRWPGSRATGLDLDDAVRDLGDLELEEALDEAGVGARHDDLGAFGGLSDLDDVRLESAAVVVALVGDLLGLGQERLDLAEVEERVAVVALLDDPGHDVAFAAGVLLVLAVALGLADALQDDLLARPGRRCGRSRRGVVPLAGDVAVLVELLAVRRGSRRSRGRSSTKASSAAFGSRL